MGLKQRMKEALLFWDELVVEEGLYTAIVGANGSVAMIGDINDPLINERKRRPTGGDFTFAIDGRVVVGGSAERRFFAEHSTILKEISAANNGKLPSGIVEAPFEIDATGKAMASEMNRRDQSQVHAWRRSSSRYLRDLAVECVNHDLVLSYALDADVSMDGYFSPWLRRKRLPMVHGPNVLRVMIPNFTLLRWEQLLELRDHPALDSFRAKLAEIEREAHADLVNGESVFREKILRRASIDLAENWRPPSGWSTAGKIGLDLLVGLLPFGGAVVGAVDEIRDAEQRKSAWGALFLRLVELTEP